MSIDYREFERELYLELIKCGVDKGAAKSIVVNYGKEEAYTITNFLKNNFRYLNK